MFGLCSLSSTPLYKQHRIPIQGVSRQLLLSQAFDFFLLSLCFGPNCEKSPGSSWCPWLNPIPIPVLLHWTISLVVVSLMFHTIISINDLQSSISTKDSYPYSPLFMVMSASDAVKDVWGFPSYRHCGWSATFIFVWYTGIAYLQYPITCQWSNPRFSGQILFWSFWSLHLSLLLEFHPHLISRFMVSFTNQSKIYL